MASAPLSARDRLLAELRTRVADERVLDAIARIPRGPFVPADVRDREWENTPLPIGEDQAISQPLMVAVMLAALEVEPGLRVLDVGTGSGWHAALLAALGGAVVSVERRPALAARARRALEGTGVEVVTGDGTDGWPAGAPYDRINVAAAARRLPSALPAQLAAGGRLVAPVGARRQELVLITRDADGTLARERRGRVSFVPLVRDA